MAYDIRETLSEYCNKHPELNNLLEEYCEDNEISVDRISTKDTIHKVKWHCDKHEYTWYDYVYNRIRYPKAPCCSGKAATTDNNFTIEYPELLKDWDYEHNDIEPTSLLSGSHKRVYWKCHKCQHEWSTMLVSRTLSNSRCSNCTKANTSRAESLLLAYFKLQYDSTSHRTRQTDSNGVIHPELDIYIPELRLAIEYDGYPWHKTKLAQHVKKLQYCKQRSITLINIAEVKDINESLDTQYSSENNVIKFKVNASYNLEGLLEIVYNYLVAIGYTELVDPSTLDKKEFKRILSEYTIQSEEDNSLGVSVPWLSEWYSTENKLALNEISKGSMSTIILQCPSCGRHIEVKAHWVKTQFNGCSACGCKLGIPEEQSEKVRKKNKDANKRAKIRKSILDSITTYTYKHGYSKATADDILEYTKELIKAHLKTSDIPDNKGDQTQLVLRLTKDFIDKIEERINGNNQ